ncbi:MAG: response regulator [Dehalococcoidia bacterium]|nr:response regulator [Dehalococcoidia bacterium]
MQTPNCENGHLSILVVDDDRAISRLVKHNLEDKDTRVFEAASGLEGLSTLSERRVDLVLLDLGLPDFNGWGILSLLRLTGPLNRLPVIIVSVEPPDSALIKRLKPDDYIQKPFDMRDLRSRVSRVMDSRRSAFGGVEAHA